MDWAGLSILIVWTVFNIGFSMRIFYLSAEVSREREELRRWTRRHDERHNRERI